MTQQLIDLVFSNPVVLVSVEHRDQNIKVREQVLQGNVFGNLDGVVGTFTPLWKLLIEWMMFGADFVSERLEQSAQKLLSATARENGDSGSQR
jgi:hypothetical protein